MGAGSGKKNLAFGLSCLILVLLLTVAVHVLSPSPSPVTLQLLFNATGSPQVPSHIASLSHSANLSIEELTKLHSVLSKAAFRNKTVIITALNQAWAAQNSMIDLFLQSFADGEGIDTLLQHMVIVCFDRVSAARCHTIPNVHCFALRTNGVDFSEEKFFMSDDYLKMMWRRIEFLRVVLEMGFNFIFSDADILWFRDPFPHLSNAADFEIACDKYHGNPYSLQNEPNGGYVHARTGDRTIEFYKFWYEARELYPGKHDQQVLNLVKNMPSFTSIGLEIRFLSTEYFSGFCQVSLNLDKVVTMHANCCTGLARKINDFNLIIEDWKRYKSMTVEERQLQKVFWRAPKECLNSFVRQDVLDS